MKMKFIPLLLVLGFITANSQITTTNGASVFVSSNTLVYSTGDLTVGDTTTKITNKGNIRIASGTVKSVSSDNASGKFEITYDGPNQYGQLIVDSGTPASGIVTVTRPIANAGPYAYLGVPFVNYNYLQLYQDLTNNRTATNADAPKIPCGVAGGSFGTNTPYGGGDVMADCSKQASRWNRNPIFGYNNAAVRWDPYTGASSFENGKYYMIRESQYNTVDFAASHSFKGTPYVATSATSTIAFPKRVGNVNIGNKALNPYNIYYYTYLTDPFVTMNPAYGPTTSNADLDNAKYADNMLWLTNPYTSNLDVFQLLAQFDQNTLVGIGSDGVVDNAATGQQRYAGKVQIATVTGTSTIGDNTLRYIPPMTNFFIKANQDGLSVNLTNTSNVQTFTMGGYTFGGTSPISTGRVASNNTLKAAGKTASTGSDIYQLNLALKSNDTYYNNTYIAAGSALRTGVTGIDSHEASSTDVLDGNPGLYTMPEALTGGIAPGFEDSKLYINVINSDAAKVAIPLGVNLTDGDKGKSFTFYAKDLRVNQETVDKSKANFDNADARFYFHDKGANGNENIVKLIDNNFSYTVTLNNSSTNRFEIFWKEAGTLANEDVQTLTGVTTVYKTGSDYKVRFDQNWTKADVSIFDVLGQLISTEKNINTQNDYLLPLNNSSSSTMYLIVITNEKGEKVTKKIVK